MKLYSGDRKTLLKYLHPEASSTSVKRVLNGLWTLEFTHKLDEVGEMLERGLYVMADTPKGEQLFKIRMIDSEGENTKKITAFHRFYDLKNNYIKDTNIVNKTRKQAVQQLLDNTLRSHEFTVESNTGTKNGNLRIVGNDPFTALMGNQDNTVLKRYGGEIDFDGDKIIIEDIIGKDDGYLVTWNKNMTELNESLDDTNLITQIVPVGKERLMLDELTVDSIFINSYEDIYTKEITFNDIGVDSENGITEVMAKEMLREAAKKYFRETECDIIKTSYDIALRDIKNNPKYKECSFFYNLDIGDTIIILKNKGLRIKNRIVSYEYNPILKEFIKLNISSNIKTLTSGVGQAQSNLNNILNSNGSINSEKLEGIVNLLNISMSAMVESAERHHAKAILFEDRVAGSKTYGAAAMGTKGLMIANEWDSTKNDWKWNTFIAGGLVYADWLIGKLKTVLIQNMDGSFEIDLNKAGGALFRNNGKDAIKIAKNKIDLFNWAVSGDYIGSLGSLYDSTNKIAVLSLYNDIDSIISIGYDKAESNTVGVYMYFDKYKLKNNYPITILENTLFNSDLIIDVAKRIYTSCIYGSPEIGDGTPATSIIRMGSPVAFDEGITNDLTVRGNVYANNIPRSLNDTNIEVAKEDCRLITAAEYNQLKTEVEELKKKVM